MSRNRVSNRKKIRNASGQFFLLYMISLGLFGWALYSYVSLAPKKAEEVNLARLGSLEEYEKQFGRMNAEMDSVLQLIESLDKARSFDYVEDKVNDRIRLIEEIAQSTKYDPKSFRDLTHTLLRIKESTKDMSKELREKREEVDELKDDLKQCQSDLADARMQAKMFSN